MLCLVARYEEQVVRWPVPAADARLGSDATNDVVIPFPGVSRLHAVVSRAAGGAVRLADAGSKNGVVLNGSRVSEVLLQPGQQVRLGRAVVSIEDAPEEEVEIIERRSTHVNSHATETAHDRSSHDGAAAAVQLIRQIEAGGGKFSGRRRQMFLESCRDLLAARAVALFRIGGSGQLHILAIAGRLPSDETLLGAAPSARRRAWSTITRAESGHVTVAAGRASTWIAAVLDAQPKQWGEDFVAYIAEKLVPHADVDSEPSTHEEPRDATLVIPPGMVVGASDAMKALLRSISATVASRLDVLLLGETGTGKELFARMIHLSGPAAGGPFLAINCAAIPSELLESELFGVHGRVATGVDPRVGLFSRADGGSLLLDEVGELPERLQAKLLRVLQEREVLPVGAPAPRKIDVRVISASNRDLSDLVKSGQFRADLFYRLRGLQFHIPPLRARKEDIPPLVFEFIDRACEEYRKNVRGVTRGALDRLVGHDWPGNVRELESEIRRAVLVCPEGAPLQREHLDIAPPETAPPSAGAPTDAPLNSRIEATERQAIEEALRKAGGVQARAARLLGITRNGLALKLRRLGLR